MRFNGKKLGESGFVLLSLVLHILLIAGFCVWSATHAVSAAPGEQIIEVALVVDNSLPHFSETSQAASQKTQPPKRVEPPVHREPGMLKKTPIAAKERKFEAATNAASSTEKPSSVASVAQAAAGSQSVDAYAATLLAWLDKHKKYPAQARAEHMEGRAILWLAIQPDGTIADFRIEQSSGSSVLDEAITRMIQNANPVPPPPGATSVREFKVPVIFKLRAN